MAKFSDSLRDTVGSVLEGYISAYGGDPTVTPTYQARKRREELALEQEKARVKSAQDEADRAAELEMYEAKKLIDQSFEDPDGISEEQQRAQNVIGGLRQSIQGSDALAIKPQRFALGETVNNAVQELTANVGERASQIDLSMYREEVRPKVASLIRASTDVRTSGVMNEEAKEGAYIDIANELAKYDEDMIPQMTTQQMSDKNDEIFRINMTPLIGGAYGYTDKNTGAMKILHNNSEVAEYEANLAQRAKKEELRIQDARQMSEAIRAIPDSEIVALVESEYGKGALDEASPEERTEAINLGRQKRAIQMMEQREDLFNLSDAVAYDRLDASERKKYDDLAMKSKGGYMLADGSIQGIDSSEMLDLPALAYDLFVNEQDAKRERYRIEKLRIEARANESLMRRAASNPALRRVLLGRVPSSVLAEAAVQGQDPLDYLRESGQTDLIRGSGQQPEITPQPTSALRTQAESAVNEATTEPKQPVQELVEEQKEVPELPYSPEIQQMVNQAGNMFTTSTVGVGGVDMFRDDRTSAYAKLTAAGIPYEKADSIIKNVNPLLLAHNMESMPYEDAIRKTIMDTVEAYAKGRESTHISGQTNKTVESHINAGTPVLTGTEEEQAEQLQALLSEDPSAVFITADGRIGQGGTEGVVQSIPDTIDKTLEDAGEFVSKIPESEIAQMAGGYGSWYRENVGMPLVGMLEDATELVSNLRKDTSEKLEGMSPSDYGLPSNTEELVALLDFANKSTPSFLNKEEADSRRKEAYDKYMDLKAKRGAKDSYNSRMNALLSRFEEKKQELAALKKSPATFENTQKRLAVVSEIKVIQDLARYMSGEPGSDFDPNKPRPERLPEVSARPIEAPTDFKPLFRRSDASSPVRLPEVGSRTVDPEREAKINSLLDSVIPRPTRLPPVEKQRPTRLPRASAKVQNASRDAKINEILAGLYPENDQDVQVSEKYRKTKVLLEDLKKTEGERSLEKLIELLDSVK